MKQLYLEELEVIKSSLWNKELPLISKKELLIKELKQQNVISLINNLNDESINTYILDNLVNFNLHLKICNLIKDILDKSDIHFVFFKGLVSSYYYKDPSSRTLGDVDVLVSHNDYKLAIEALLNNGFKKDHKTSLHYCLDYEGVLIELHTFFGGFDSLDKTIFFDNLIQEGINNRELIDINGIKLPALSDTLNGLILIEHIDMHIKTGIGLRQIIDFMMFIDKRGFNNELNKHLKSLDLLHETKLVTRTCINYLGLKDNYDFCKDIDKDLTTKFIELVLDNGDFSIKKGKINTKAKSLNRNNKSFIEKIKFIHNKGKENSNFIKKHKSLSFLGFIFGIKYGFGIIRNNSLKTINNSLKESKKYSKTIKELGIKESKKRYDYYEGKFVKKDED